MSRELRLTLLDDQYALLVELARRVGIVTPEDVEVYARRLLECRVREQLESAWWRRVASDG